jgi:hypothetical protein
MRFVDYRAVHFRRELVEHAVTIVDPNLEDVDIEGRLLAHRGPCLLCTRQPVRNLRAPGLRGRHPATRRAIQRSARKHLAAHLKHRRAVVEAKTHGRTHAEVRATGQILNESGALAAQMRVRVHDRRHDRKAGEVHAHGVRGNRHLTRSADCQKTAIGNHQRCVFERRGPVADDHARTYERGDASCCSGRRRRGFGCRPLAGGDSQAEP